MIENDIHVTITGRAGSGKSTVSSIIERALAAEGLSVVLGPQKDYSKETLKNRHAWADLAIHTLRDRDGSVVLHEVQANREPNIGDDPRFLTQTFRPGR